MKHYLAIDLGATSGRVILGTLTDGGLELEEISRFRDDIIKGEDGYLHWDLPAIWHNIIETLRKVSTCGIHISSIGIDTWGVDMAMFSASGDLLQNPLCYRDAHTQGEPENYATKHPGIDVYVRTGIEVMPINSLFQLSALRDQRPEVFKDVDKILFMPDAIGFLLTGRKVAEVTIASTSQMLKAEGERAFDKELLGTVGVNPSNFGDLVSPGTTLGTLQKSVQEKTGLGPIPVTSVGGHDTASAIAAVPAQGTNFAFISSGTWSLMGTELRRPIINEETRQANFTNEKGVDGAVCFLKNLCGMWLLESCRKQWAASGQNEDYGELMEKAEAVTPFRSFIYPDAPEFAMPQDMVSAIQSYCEQTGQWVPMTPGEITRVILDSLAMRYRQVLLLLRRLTGKSLPVLHIIGGGCRNWTLNQLTADVTEIPVITGPVEATAIGNILVQAQAHGDIKPGLESLRQKVRQTTETKTFEPRKIAGIEEAIARFDKLPHQL